MKLEIELQPFWVPEQVFSTKADKDGRKPVWSLKDIPAESLSEMCDKFREDVFKAVGKVDPRNVPTILEPKDYE